jgi:large conductance mechanosensitive channel
MRNFADEFKKFILRGNMVDLAVGIVIGAAFGSIVSSLVADIFMPVVGLLTGGFNTEGLRVHLYGDAYLQWGKFLQAVINFLIVGFCMFIVVKGMNVLHNRLVTQEAAKAPEPTPTEKLLAEIRDILREKTPPPVVAAAGP